MLAFALFLLDTEGADRVEIHPDGEHGKRFDIAGWLNTRGFDRRRTIGSTVYGGEYGRADGKRIIVDPKSGLGDVVTEIAGEMVVAECKGGVINTTHPGQKSRLYSGLCETVGMLMAKPEADREYAVVPSTPNTRRLAKRMATRCKAAGIVTALVNGAGQVELVSD